MTKRFVVTKDEITQTITYKEYDNFKGYDVKPKNKLSKEDIINVDEMVIINPSLIEKLISKKCKKTLERILKFISFIYDDDETGEESVELALNEIAKFKELLDTKYKDHKLVGGQYPNCRDCHIRPDIVLVYSKSKDKLILELVRVGQHNHLNLTSSLDTSR